MISHPGTFFLAFFFFFSCCLLIAKAVWASPPFLSYLFFFFAFSLSYLYFPHLPVCLFLQVFLVSELSLYTWIINKLHCNDENKQHTSYLACFHLYISYDFFPTSTAVSECMVRLMHLLTIKSKISKKGLKRSLCLVLFNLWYMNHCGAIADYKMVLKTIIKNAPGTRSHTQQDRVSVWAGTVSSWLPAAVQDSLKCLLLDSPEFIKVPLFNSDVRYPWSQLPDANSTVECHI